MEITVEELNELLEKAIDDAFKRYNNQKGKIYTSTWIYNDPTSSVPEACRNCSNHPSNGGSGNCQCILGQQVIY